MRAVEVDEPAESVAPPPEDVPATAPAGRLRELSAYAGYLILAVVVLLRLWISPSGRVLSANDDDHGVNRRVRSLTLQRPP